MFAFAFNIFMTYGCNRECEGCYIKNSSADPNLKMTVEKADDITKWILQFLKEEDVQRYVLAFLGGEPLSNSDVLFHFIDNMRTDLKVQPLNQGRPFTMFTNGDYFSDDILDKMKERRMTVMLNPTYDSLQNIENKLIKVIEHCGRCSLAIVLTETNMARITDLVKLALKYGCHTRIQKMYGGGNNSEYVKEYGRKMREVLDIILADPVPMYPNWLVESSWPMREEGQNPTANPYACGKWHLMIEPDGGIRSCNSDQDTKVGSIYTHKRLSDFNFHQRWSAKNLPECQGCEFIHFCQGGCPYSRKLTYGTYDRKSPFCEEFKTLYPRLLELVKKFKEYNKC